VPTACPQSISPPAHIAHAVAAISVTLPGSPTNARARLAVVEAECDAHPDWSEETRVALYRISTPWLALACSLGRSIPALQAMDSVDLLALLTGGKLPAVAMHSSRLKPSAEPTPDARPADEETGKSLVFAPPAT
jgi:hypothetical protein